MSNRKSPTTVFWLTAALSCAMALKAHAANDVQGLKPDTLVNGKAISSNHVTLLSASFSREHGLKESEAETAARTELVTQELLAQAARREGLDKKATTADQIAYQERAILSRAYLENYFEKNPITDADLKKSYEWNRANGKIVELKLRQILVASENEARSLSDQLAKGADFATLAKTSTQDPGGQSNGGDLGWFRPDIFVDHNFTDAVVGLKKGQVSKPFRSRFGWHVVKLEDGPRPVAKPEPYEALSEAAQQAIRQKTAQLQLEALTEKLASNAKVARADAPARNTKTSFNR